MKKIGKTIYYAIMGVVIVVSLTLIISVFPIPGNIQILTVLSGSMEPSIKTGSVVVIKPSSEYEKGDVITFGSGTPTTHRIVDSRIQDGNTVYQTKGDANNSPDGQEVSQNSVIGKVLFDVPFVGYLISFIQKPVGFLIFVIIPAVIIVSEELKKVGREVKSMHKKKIASKTNNENE